MIMSMSFDVTRVRVPRGFLTVQGKVWNHVDEQILPADTIELLQRNCLRVARGRTDSWPPIKALLETQPRVEVVQNRLTASNGLPLLLELDAAPHDQVPFLYRQDGTLGGISAPESMNLFRVAYGAPPTGTGAMLQVMPEIRLNATERPTGPSRWQPVPWSPPTRPLHELAFQVTLAEGEFLAIGPAPLAWSVRNVVGSLWLCEDSPAGQMENLYFIVPQSSTVSHPNPGGP